MPFAEVSKMDRRQQFVVAARQEGANLRALCRQYGISPPTGYKWLARATAGDPVLADRSRRPHTSPRQTPPAMEAAVLALRSEHPAWGGRKLAKRLAPVDGVPVPSPSTITAILRRHGRLEGPRAGQPRALTRFARAQPNELWQMDFKGHVPLGPQGRCHPLTVLDDHSRFALGLVACANEQTATVQTALTAIFRTYGVPERILCDHGAPWGSDPAHRYTPLTVWLLRVGVRVSHGRPRHPQTQGKDERFHRTLRTELLGRQSFLSFPACQTAFDAWRTLYNTQRPHEALALDVPAAHYQPSPRPFPDPLPPVDYPPGTLVRRVQHEGWLTYQGRRVRIAKAFHGYPVALEPTATDGLLAVRFLTQQVATLDLRAGAHSS